MERNDTEGARSYAMDIGNDSKDVNDHWWSFFSGYRLKQWQTELRALMQEKGMSEEEIGAYTGLTYSKRTSFMVKLPARRTSYIGIGMALGQPLETINRWIGKYGKKQQLYPKDVCEDLIWIYLIHANTADPHSEINYYRMFDRCADAVYRTYCSCWADYINREEGTDTLGRELSREIFDADFRGIRAFVVDHMDAFKTAFARPRRMLASYTAMILDHLAAEDSCKGRGGLSQLRGYIDDSMLNYLSGDPDTIHNLEQKSSDRHLVSFKHVPKGRRTHIALALALGMTREEVDRYLELMGFTVLDAVIREEGILIHALEEWERRHPLQRRLKRKTLEGDASIEMTDEEAGRAVREMLRLRQDMGQAFAAINLRCPYVAKE